MENSLKAERAKLREMNFRAKMQYIWGYYKIHIGVFIIVVAVAGSLINTWFFNPPAQEYLYIAWRSPPVRLDQLEDLGERLTDIVTDPDSQVVRASFYSLGTHTEMDVAMHMRLTTLLAVGSVDLFFSSMADVYEFAEQGLIQPIHGVIDMLAASDPALFEELTERTVTITFVPRDENVPVSDAMAISLSDSPLLESIGIASEDLFVSMVASSNRVYEASKAIQMLLQQLEIT